MLRLIAVLLVLFRPVDNQASCGETHTIYGLDMELNMYNELAHKVSYNPHFLELNQVRSTVYSSTVESLQHNTWLFDKDGYFPRYQLKDTYLSESSVLPCGCKGTLEVSPV